MYRLIDKPRLFGVLVGVLIFVALIINLSVQPTIWWDEGWNMMLARNWVQGGFYGQIMDGHQLPPGLAAAFPVVAPIALSFKLFSVGVWQGRLPGVLFTLADLALITYFARILYRPAVAWWTLFVLIFTPMATGQHVLVLGRQALGEMPAIFFLLAGYLFFFQGLRRSVWYGVLAAVCWGVALVTKGQVLPFWLASVALVLIIAIFKRWWRPAASIGLIIPGSLLVGRVLFPELQNLILRGKSLPVEQLSGIFQTFAMVVDPLVRQFAIGIVLLVGLLPLIGILYESWKSLRLLRYQAPSVDTTMLRWGLLGLAGSWMAWYIGLGMYWVRYLFPATFLGSLFAAAMLDDLTYRYDLRKTFRQAAQFFSFRHGSIDPKGFRYNLRSLALVVWILSSITMTALSVRAMLIPYQIISPHTVAEYLLQATGPNDLIETYESEIMFLADRRYHFPPDQVSLDLVRKKFIDQEYKIDYDPLQADPDFLLVGYYSEDWHLYDPWEESGDFKLIREFPGYKVYARVR